jgi:hypothetical protein
VVPISETEAIGIHIVSAIEYIKSPLEGEIPLMTDICAGFPRK